MGPEAARLLGLLGLQDHADRACAAYSGGYRRKLSVAVALVGGAQVRWCALVCAGLQLQRVLAGPASTPCLALLANHTHARTCLTRLTQASRWCCWMSPPPAWTLVRVRVLAPGGWGGHARVADLPGRLRC